MSYGCNPCYNGSDIRHIIYTIEFSVVVILVLMEKRYTFVVHVKICLFCNPFFNGNVIHYIMCMYFY